MKDQNHSLFIATLVFWGTLGFYPNDVKNTVKNCTRNQ